MTAAPPAHSSLPALPEGWSLAERGVIEPAALRDELDAAIAAATPVFYRLIDRDDGMHFLLPAKALMGLMGLMTELHKYLHYNYLQQWN